MLKWALATVTALPLIAACSVMQAPASPEITPVQRVTDANSVENAANLLARGRRSEAEAAYRGILAREPDNYEARYGLAEALRLGGEHEAAKVEYLAVADIPEWRVRALEGIGQTNLLTGDHNAAYEALAAAVDEDSAAWRALLGLAQLRDLARDWPAADEAYAAALAATTEPAVVYNNHGVSKLARGEPEEASELFRKALAAEPGFERAQTNLELASAVRGLSPAEIAKAEPDARKRAQKLNNYGYVAMLQGRLDEAEQYFRAAIAEHPAFYSVAYENMQVLNAMKAER